MTAENSLSRMTVEDQKVVERIAKLAQLTFAGLQTESKVKLWSQNAPPKELIIRGEGFLPNGSEQAFLTILRADATSGVLAELLRATGKKSGGSDY